MPRLSLLLTAWLLLAGWSEAAAPTRTAPPTVAGLTSSIDSRLAASFRETRVAPGPRADDPEFLRYAGSTDPFLHLFAGCTAVVAVLAWLVRPPAFTARRSSS
jgi:hypothetical protein